MKVIPGIALIKRIILTLLIASASLAVISLGLSFTEWFPRLQANNFDLSLDVVVLTLALIGITSVICFYLLVGCGLSCIGMVIFEATLLAMVQMQQLAFCSFDLWIRFCRQIVQFIQYGVVGRYLKDQPHKQHDYLLAKFPSLSKLPYQLFPISCILLN